MLIKFSRYFSIVKETIVTRWKIQKEPNILETAEFELIEKFYNFHPDI